MNYFDDSRPKIGTHPCWLDGSKVLPAIQLVPSEYDFDRWRFMIMCPINCFREVTVNIADVPNLMREFRLSPEAFISLMFNEVAPTKREPFKSRSKASAPVAIIEDDDF